MPRNPRRYDLEYKDYGSKPEVMKDRAQRNAARRQAMRDGVVSKGDGKDIDHKTPISKGGTNAKNNLRAVPASKNRSFARTPSGKMK
jgi:hypothetical protein